MFNVLSQLIRLAIVNGLLVGVFTVDVSGQQGQESGVNQPSTEPGELPH